MKKLLSILALLSLLSLTACGEKTTQSADSQNQNTASYDDEYTPAEIYENDGQNISTATDGAASLDEAMKCFIDGYYSRDTSKWLTVIPQKFIDEHPDIPSKSADVFNWFGETTPEEYLPGGMDALEYWIDKDLSGEYLSNNTRLKQAMSKYGVNDITGAWYVKSNTTLTGQTLIVESNNRYYATHALARLIKEYDPESEDISALFY